MPINIGLDDSDVPRTRPVPNTRDPYSQLGPSPVSGASIAYVGVVIVFVPMVTKPWESRSTRSTHSAHVPPTKNVIANTERMIPAINDPTRRFPERAIGCCGMTAHPLPRVV